MAETQRAIEMINQFKKLKEIKEGCATCIKKRKNISSEDFEGVPFIKYHQKLSDDTSKVIKNVNISNPKKASDLKPYIDAILEEKKYLKEFLIKKGVNMTGVTFEEYPNKICNELVLEKGTSIQLYQTTNLYEGWYLYFRLVDEDKTRISSSKRKITVKFERTGKTYTATYNSSIEAYYCKIPDGTINQNIIFSYGGESGFYKSCSRKVAITIGANKTLTKSPSSLATNENCPEKSGGSSTKWRAWDRLKPTGLSCCGYMGKSTACTSYSCPAIAGKNGTHHTPSILDVNFSGIGTNALKILKATFTFYDAQYPMNTYISSDGTKPVPIKTKTNCPGIPKGTVKFKSIAKTCVNAPTKCGTDNTNKWNKESFSWSGDWAGSDLKATISWGKNTLTNPGELWVKGCSMAITYIPKQTAPTKATNFTR